MSRNFGREYRLTIGQPGKQGVLIGETKAKNGMAMHVNFSCEKGDKESNNTATIKLWNLGPATLAEIKKKDAIVELRAGYGATLPLIFAGNISTSSTEQENANLCTTIEVIDGQVATRDTYVSVSYGKGTKAMTAMEGIAQSMGTSAVIAEDAKQKLHQKVFANGFSAMGAAKNVLHKLCETCGLQWNIQNGVLQVAVKGGAITTKAYVLSAETGLLDVPKEITENASNSGEKKKDSWKGYEVRYFMNGAIGVGDMVKLDSKYAKGYFVVKSISISGDNFEGEWTCTAKLKEVKA